MKTNPPNKNDRVIIEIIKPLEDFPMFFKVSFCPVSANNCITNSTPIRAAKVINPLRELEKIIVTK